MHALNQLLVHIDLLRGQHRAGIGAPFGDIEKLFDLGADVRSELATTNVTKANALGTLDPAPGSRVRLAIEVLDNAGAVRERTVMAEVTR